MRHITVEEMVSSNYNSTAVICKEQEKNGKLVIETTLKCSTKIPKLIEGVEVCSFDIRHNGILNVEEMLELSKNNPKLYTEKFILSNFGNDYILEAKKSKSPILSGGFKLFYNNCISFSNRFFQVYFPDKAINHFSELVDKLEAKRTEDTLKYSTEMINKGIVKNLKINLFEQHEYEQTNCCYFDTNEIWQYQPQNVLYYQICLDENGTFNKCDLENIKKILELFASKQSGVDQTKTELFDGKQKDINAIIHTNGDGNIMIDGCDKYPEIIDYANSLIKR